MNKHLQHPWADRPALRRIHRGASLSRGPRGHARPRAETARADDPSFLAEQLQGLKERQGLMIRTNARLRRGARCDLQDVGLCGGDVARLEGQVTEVQHGFPEAEIRRNAGAIRKLEMRVKDADRLSEASPLVVQHDEFTYTEDPQHNRVAFAFQVRPDVQARGVLSDHGFKPRGPMQLEWGRVMNSPGLAAAARVRRLLSDLAEQG